MLPLRTRQGLTTAAFCLLLGLLIVGCGGDDAEPTRPPTIPRPAATRTTAPTPLPTTPPRTVIPEAQATAAPQANLCPLTGQSLGGTTLEGRRPLLIKLGNSPPERPQSGLQEADVIVEHLTEGAITRFSAVYYCTAAAEIGPIRSARLIDLELVPMFGAIFAHVGGSEPVRQMIARSEIAPADLDDYGRAPIFREIETRKRPFNRYTSTQELWALAAQNSMITGVTVPAFQFAIEAPPGGRAANQVTVPYRANLSDAVFRYEPQSNTYLRSSGSTPHLDPATNLPLHAANVIVLFATHETTDIIEDSLGSRSIKITTSGSGRGTLLRDGQAYDVTWSRSDPHALWQFTGANGSPLALAPGNTWIEVVPPSMQVTVE
jgi:hypothetical protein